MAYPFRDLYSRSWVLGYPKDTPPFLLWQSTTFDYNSTDIGEVHNADVHNARAFAHRFLQREGADLLREQFLSVDGYDAYEFCYMRKPILRKPFYFCKIVVPISGKEYLIQLASRNLEADETVFDHIVQSVRFEFAGRR